MDKYRISRLITLAFILVGLGGIPAMVAFVQRSVSENPIFLGLSLARLVVFIAGVFGILTLFTLAVVTQKKGLVRFPLPKKYFTGTMISLLILLVICYLLCFTPRYNLGDYADHLVNLRPVTFWAFGTCLLFILVLCIGQFGMHPDIWLSYARTQRRMWFTSLVTASLMILVLGAGIALKVMDYRKEDFWYGTGVPLLMWQVILAIVFGLIIPRIIHKDKILFILIWVIAGVLWASWPYGQTFSMSQPLPPNFESYPIFDSTYYDVGSQFALIGEGINGNSFTDRPFYMFILFLLHRVVGQDYAALENLQAALFAVFPALVYLLGKRLHSHQAGISAGLLITFRGINSLIASPWINNSHLKNILVDFPTLIAVVAFTLFLVRALQRNKWTDLLWAAGMLGSAILLRLHTLIFIPLLGGVAIYLLLKRPWIQWVKAGVLLALGFSLIIAPWLISNRASVNQFLQFRLMDMLEQRYSSSESYSPLRTIRARSLGTVRPKFESLSAADSGIPFQVVHFLHNLIVTPLSLPVTFSLEDVRHTVKENPYWDPSWNGDLNPQAVLMISLSLLVVSLGIGAGTKNGGLAGLLPALILPIYYAANSFSRTSGGRYLVPGDWVIYLYLAVGAVELIRMVGLYFGIKTEPPAQKRPGLMNPWSRQTGLVLSALLAIGLFIPIIPGLVEPVYPQRLKKREVINLITTTDLLSSTSLTNKQISEFIKFPKSVAVQGRALYPIYFKQDDGLRLLPRFSQSPKPYPRLVFKVIGARLNTFIILPSETIPALPHETDVIVIGCRERNEIQALAVIIPEQKVWYLRSHESPLTCPLKIPVCDNNKNCN